MSKQAEELADRDLKAFTKLLRNRGITVRREKLVRGSVFRAKSGRCHLFGEPVVFLDKALPAEQQLQLLLDFVMERNLHLTEKELSELSSAPRALFRERIKNALPDLPAEEQALNESGDSNSLEPASSAGNAVIVAV